MVLMLLSVYAQKRPMCICTSGEYEFYKLGNRLLLLRMFIQNEKRRNGALNHRIDWAARRGRR